MDVKPYQAINTHFIVYAQVEKHEGFTHLDIVRVQDQQILKRFKLSDLQNHGATPPAYQWHILTFLPLDEYQLTLSGGQTSVSTYSSYDTRRFPAMLKIEPPAKPDEPPVLVFHRGGSIPKTAIAGQLKPLAPLGMQTSSKPLFRWQADNAAKDLSYHLYVFQDATVVWKTVVKDTKVNYDGPKLTSGTTYHWALGAEKDGQIWEMKRVGIFSLP